MSYGDALDTARRILTKNMKTRGLHWYAILTAICVLYVIVNGAVLTTLGPVGPVEGLFSTTAHRDTATVCLAMVLGLAIWITVADRRSWLRKFAWVIFLGIVALASLGEMAAGGSFPRGASVAISC